VGEEVRPEGIMVLQSLVTTRDGRLTKGQNYECEIVYLTRNETCTKRAGWRVRVLRDNTGKPMTFNPDVLIPPGKVNHATV
jgi:hypothetical protein